MIMFTHILLGYFAGTETQTNTGKFIIIKQATTKVYAYLMDQLY